MANYFFPTLVGVKSDIELDKGMEKLTDKAKVVSALKGSLEHMRKVINEMPDSSFGKATSIFGTQGTYQGVFLLALSHNHEHLGQALELHEGARVLAEEVNVMPLPSRLVSAAEALADASDILAEEAGRAGEGTIGEESIEAIARTDIDRVARAFAHADAMLAPRSEEYGIDEQDVYGRGLYIS